MPHQYSGGVKGDPHGLGGDDNSHYIPSTGELAWGEGGVDDAEDEDVILHELGHGLHDWLTGGSLSQVEGLSEGSGDYWAHSYNRSTGFWDPADPQYNWMFQWDGHNEFWGGRITNYSATYPGGLVGQIHTDGQIWASTLMQIWEDIGRTATDLNFLEALSMTNSITSQEDAAQAFVQADLNNFGGANLWVRSSSGSRSADTASRFRRRRSLTRRSPTRKMWSARTPWMQPWSRPSLSRARR